MNRPARSAHPLASISTNIIVPASSPPAPTKLSANVVARLEMENRVTQYGEGSDTQTSSFGVLDDDSNDSAFEHKMLLEMRAQREAIETRRVPRQPFSRAGPRLRSRIALDQPNRPIPARVSSPLEDDHSRPDGNPSAQSPNLSGTFGTKAKRSLSFLDRYKAPNITQTPPVESSDPVDWASAAADVPLPSTEESPLSRKSSARNTPATAQKDKASYEKVLSWNVSPDFSGQSLLASTPAPPRRNARLQEIRQAEIDAAEEASYFPPPAISLPPASGPKPAYDGSNDARERLLERLKKGNGVARTDKVASAVSRQTEGIRQDSRQLLRMLSRSVSSSPSPPRGTGSPGSPAREGEETAAAVAGRSPSSNASPAISSRKPFARASGRQKQYQASPPRIQPNTPAVTGAWIDTPAAEKPISTARQANPDPSSSQEPAIFDQPSLQRKSSPRKDPRKAVEPELPQSALSAIIGKAKRGQADGLGDSTIHSLEEIINLGDNDDDISITEQPLQSPEQMRPTEEERDAIREILERRLEAELDYGDGLPPSAEEKRLIRDIVEQRMERGAKGKRHPVRQPTGKSADDDDENLYSLSRRRRRRVQEDFQLQRMSEHVHNMHSRTRSLNAGLSRLERRVAGGSGCRHCGCPGKCYGTAPWAALGRSVLALFVRDQDGKKRLTLLSWVMLLSMLWLVAEIVLCYNYCRPVFADVWDNIVGFEMYKDAPEPPYVTLTILFGPLQSLLYYPLTIFSSLFSWLWNLFWYLLENDNTLPSTRTTSEFASATARLARSVVPEVDLSMDADEIL